MFPLSVLIFLGTTFCYAQVELPESAPLFKEGYIRKKNIMDAPHKKVPRGKRQWKPYYVFLKGFLMYFVPVS